VNALAPERLVLDSFRTVEAIVDEPGNNLTRFHERLRMLGSDPDQTAGLSERRKYRLENRIRWLQELRDSVAAHGKRRRKNQSLNCPLPGKQFLVSRPTRRIGIHCFQKRGEFRFFAFSSQRIGGAPERVI
jgi:hypothetical protein